MKEKPNVIYEHKNELTFIGFHTEITPDEGDQKCPEFWDKEYAEKYTRLWQTMKPETPMEAAILANGIGMYAIWMIELKDGTHIGELCFKGLSEDGTAEIGYGIAEDYQGCGYATEAVSALVDWAFKQTGVMGITAETEESNIASQRVLAKAGFIPTGETGEEGPLFARGKIKTER